MVLVGGLVGKALAQGTAFIYQGRLNNNGSPASGTYDLRFSLYDASTNGNSINIPQTNFATAVSSGLFAATLDFGPVFTGTNYWLAIGVRTNGNTGAFTVLWPRQALLPVPYAVFATSASNLLGTLPAAQLAGTLPSADLAGTYAGTVNFANAANTFSGSFAGNGALLTNLNASQLASGTVSDARLSTNVALLNQSQTYGGANFFTGANNFTNRGNSFIGSFFGNGLVGWIPVSTTATNAAVDHGYLLLSAGLTTVTLPALGALTVGDIVRISGGGAGGWLVAENTSESIIGNFASYRNGYVLSLPATTLPAGSGFSTGSDCHGIAASADGTCMFVAGSSGYNGIYSSSDSGHTWSLVNGLSGTWNSLACSANGKTVYAAPSSTGTIQMSTNGGLTWTATGSSGTTVACSADGTKFFTGNIACSGNGNYLAEISSGISVSNSISGWFSIPVPFGTPTCLAASSDCTRLVAGVSGGLLYASANQGTTWTTLTATNQYWSGAWMSADGNRFAATVGKSGSFNGGVFYGSIIAQPNTISTNGTICGSQGAAVELQYIGGGQFTPVSSTGSLWAN